jgi:hypothetical protein
LFQFRWGDDIQERALVVFQHKSRFVKLPRRHLKMTRRHLKMTRRHLKMTRRHLKMTRRHLKMTRRHLKMTRRHLKMTRRHLKMARLPFTGAAPASTWGGRAGKKRLYLLLSHRRYCANSKDVL